MADSAGTPGPAPRPPAPSPDPAGGPASPKRRRGSRGGRNRNKNRDRGGDGGSQAPPDRRPDHAGADRRPDHAGADRRPDDLPDRPIEGRPSPEAAARATVRPGGDPTPAPFVPKFPPPRPAAATPGPASADAPAGAGAPPPPPATPATPASPARKRRRGGRGRGRATTNGPTTGPTAGPATGPASRPTPTAPPAPADEELAEQRRGRERKGRPVGRYLMCVHVQPEAAQIAILEGRSLIEYYVSRPQDDVSQIDGNIYLGRVQNVLPGMEAAFIDIGTPKNAVLYRGDVRYDRDEVEGADRRSARIEQLLRPGQSVMCQVTKNPIGTKGARLTQEVSLPGRFVVLVPDSETGGISKRLADNERKRLRRLLDDIKPAGHGVIVRTAAEGVTADELRRDLENLVAQWNGIAAAAKRARPPALLYREPDLAVRFIREEFNREYRGVVIDDQLLCEQVRDYVAGITPELADRVEYFDRAADPLPLFERYHVHEQLHRALDRKVWLPSGGSIIVERTEALTVIDVNTGKNVGSSSLEETVFRNNLEAADEVARQLRLRDIGGIIVIDFIDMEIIQNRTEVMRAFRNALARDKTRTQVFDISELGLVEMTRKRVSEGLVESLSKVCPACGGRGSVIDDDLVSL